MTGFENCTGFAVESRPATLAWALRVAFRALLKWATGRYCISRIGNGERAIDVLIVEMDHYALLSFIEPVALGSDG